MGADHAETEDDETTPWRDHQTETEDDDVIDEMGERGHILWIRGLSRLQHQVNKNTDVVAS